MTIKMEALRTFAGTEGFYRKGQSFEVENMKRAKDLSEAGLAKMIDEETYKSQPETEPESQPEQQPMDEPNQDVPPPQGESWGVTALGGGWYELPNGERKQGFEQAKESLLSLLETELEETPTHEGNTDDEVKLIEPVDEPEIVDLTEPLIVFTGDPNEPSESPSEATSFDKAVVYAGGGWYLLPNGERVQGKESALAVFEAYAKERGES